MIQTKWKFVSITAVTGLLIGCAQLDGGTQTRVGASSSASMQSSAEREQNKREIAATQDTIAECNRREMNTRDGKTVNSQILVLTDNNPVADRLLVSGQLLNANQKSVLRRYIKQTLPCRAYVSELKHERLRAVYQRFFTGADAVYADLLSGKSAIGAANQRMQVLKVAARSQWADAMSSINLF